LDELFTELLQTMANANADGKLSNDAAAESKSEPNQGERRQSRSLSIFARAFGKTPDSRRPSTVAAVFHAATSTLRQTPSRWSRRTSSITTDSINMAPASQTRKVPTANSVTWKESRDRLSSESPERDFTVQQREQTSVNSRLNHLQRPATTNQTSQANYDHRQQPVGDRDQQYFKRNNTSSNSSLMSDRNSYNARATSLSHLSSDEEMTTSRRPEEGNMQEHQQQLHQLPRSYDSRRLPEDSDLDGEERDYCSPTLSSNSRQKTRSSSRGQTSSAKSNDSFSPPQSTPRRLTLPSIVKYSEQTGNSKTGSGQKGQYEQSEYHQQHSK
jgi:hypothetical protein